MVNVVDMPAGFALDAIVAEKVMGRCPHPFEARRKWSIEDGNDYESGLRCTKCGKSDLYGDYCPRYSTDIAATWQVVDAQPGGHRLALTPAPDDQWCAMFGPGSYAIAETVPLAICRAALLAVEQGA